MQRVYLKISEFPSFTQNKKGLRLYTHGTHRTSGSPGTLGAN